MNTTWTGPNRRRQNPGAAIAVDDDVRIQRQAYLDKLERERRLKEAHQRVESAKAAIAAFDRSPLDAELKMAIESLKQIESEVEHGV